MEVLLVGDVSVMVPLLHVVQLVSEAIHCATHIYRSKPVCHSDRSDHSEDTSANKSMVHLINEKILCSKEPPQVKVKEVLNIPTQSGIK